MLDYWVKKQVRAFIPTVIDETFGLGPLEPLFRDATISDILINGSKTVYLERFGRLDRKGFQTRVWDLADH